MSTTSETRCAQSSSSCIPNPDMRVNGCVVFSWNWLQPRATWTATCTSTWRCVRWREAWTSRWRPAGDSSHRAETGEDTRGALWRDTSSRRTPTATLISLTSPTGSRPRSSLWRWTTRTARRRRGKSRLSPPTLRAATRAATPTPPSLRWPGGNPNTHWNTHTRWSNVTPMLFSSS